MCKFDGNCDYLYTNTNIHAHIIHICIFLYICIYMYIFLHKCNGNRDYSSRRIEGNCAVVVRDKNSTKNVHDVIYQLYNII